MAVTSGSVKRHRSRAASEIIAGSHPAENRQAKTDQRMTRQRHGALMLMLLLNQVLFTERVQHCNASQHVFAAIYTSLVQSRSK